MAEKKSASRAEKAVSEAKKKTPSATSAPKSGGKSNSKKAAPSKAAKSAPVQVNPIPADALAAVCSVCCDQCES